MNNSMFSIDFDAPFVAESATLWRVEQELNRVLYENDGNSPNLAVALAQLATARKALAACVVAEGQEWDFLAALALSLDLAECRAMGAA